MRSKRKVLFFVLGAFLLATNIAFAQDEDAEGSRDYPLISRFPGSIIKYYDVKQFDEYILPLGKLEKGKLLKSEQLEGKITRITYKAPEDRSTLEIYRNYESALKKAGFEILFVSAGEELGKYSLWPAHLYESLNPLRGDAKHVLQGDASYQRYLSAKLSRPEGDVYVSLYVSLDFYRWPMIQLDVIEVKPMETGLVAVTADALAKDIARTGHIAVYGIYFETDKADVKPESEPILKEIAKLLQQNPKLKLYVVGHTDNVGNLTYNMKLSQARADAVVKVLVSKYGADVNQLKAHGVGPLAPVASNKTEEGRAKNRRVELVEQ
jgi:flagellar motor protein MotB